VTSKLLIFVFSLPLIGARFVVLDSGFPLQVDSWEKQGEMIVLHRQGGDLTLPASRIVDFIEEEDPSSPPAETPPPAPAPPKRQAPPDPRELITEIAETYGLPAKFVSSVARAESAYSPSALSPKGAIGVMQLMPGTAKELGVDPHDVRQNIEGGARLLRDLLIRYQDDPDQVRKALAAYNAGPGAVAKHGGIPPYRETRNYVEKVLKTYQDKK